MSRKIITGVTRDGDVFTGRDSGAAPTRSSDLLKPLFGDGPLDEYRYVEVNGEKHEVRPIDSDD